MNTCTDLNHWKIKEEKKVWKKKLIWTEIAVFKDYLNLWRVRHLRDSPILFQRTAPVERDQWKRSKWHSGAIED